MHSSHSPLALNLRFEGRREQSTKHDKPTTGDFANMRILIGIVSLILLSGFTGSGIALKFGVQPHHPERVHTNLFLAVAAPPMEQSQDSINTHTEDRISELERQVQVDRDDRKLIHDDIYQLTMQEKNHYDTLHEQISIDESWLHGSTAIIGIGLTVLNALVLFTQLIDRKRRSATREVAA